MNYTKSKDPLVVYVGRIKAYKRLDHLIKSFKIIKDVIKNSKLIIAGKGDQKPLKKLSIELGIEPSVEFYDEVSEEEKLRLLRQAWVFVTPSMKEGWGITVIESNACGTPAIAYNVPGLRDSVKYNYNGILVEDGNENSLANTIVMVLKDGSLRDNLSKNALEWSKQFSWERSAEEFLKAMEAYV
jgi:glycosyltransferase involved in cell wall biosynthesis